ncbi:MAG: type II toxin-antitoxin system HicB family antitoxin [Elusimicrobiota bacterium]|nr:type II toxin-antitoxin system HicB family antitoxin [Elusimicrobiota bacterium]
MKTKFTVLIEKDEDGLLVAKVPDLAGCHTQAKTMSELLTRIREAIELCLNVRKSRHEKILLPEFVGIQQIELRV